MSSHNFSQSTVSCTKLCIKNNFLFKLLFSAGYFSPLIFCCLVGPSTLFLFCWILSLLLSPPAYFPQRSTTFNNTKTTFSSFLFFYSFLMPLSSPTYFHKNVQQRSTVSLFSVLPVLFVPHAFVSWFSLFTSLLLPQCSLILSASCLVVFIFSVSST